MKGRSLMRAGGGVRLAYGLGSLLAPDAMMEAKLAPRATASSNARFLLRGFGAQHIAIATFTLLASRSERLARPVLLLNLGIEVLDAASAAFEWHDRGAADLAVAGGLAVPGVGLAAWGIALRTLDD